MSKELTVKQETSVAIPDWATDLSTEYSDMVEVDTSLFRVPEVKIGQGVTGDVASKQFEEGDFFSPDFGINFGKTVWIIPIKLTASAAMFYSKKRKPRVWDKNLPDQIAERIGEAKEKQMVCRTPDLVNSMYDGFKCANCPFNENFDQWVDGEPPACTKSFDLYGLFASSPQSDEWVPGIMRFRKKVGTTAWKAFKAKTGLAAQAFIHPSKRKPIFMSAYGFSSYLADDGDYKWQAISDQVVKANLENETLMVAKPSIEAFLKALKDNKVSTSHDDAVQAEVVEDAQVEEDLATEDPFA